MNKISCLLAAGALCALAAAGLASPAQAQQLPLGSVAGQNPLQQRVGQSVNQTCGGLLRAGFVAGPSPQQDLTARCTEMVLNAVQVNTGMNPGQMAGVGSLGLDATALNNAILQLSNQNGASSGFNRNQNTFITPSAVRRRFIALREGDTGISIVGLPGLGSAEANVGSGLSLTDGSSSGAELTLPEGLGVFVTGNGEFGRFAGSSEELGYDLGSGGVTAGVDYRFTDELVAGVAVGYQGTKASFDGYNGDVVSNAVSPTLYASYNHGGFYADGLLSYGYTGSFVKRRIRYANINRTAHGNTNASDYTIGLGAGYEFALDQVAEGLSVGPRARFDYFYQTINGFDEFGANGLNLRYDPYRINSAITSLGIDASYAISTDFGVLTPQVRVDWQHEFLNDNNPMSARFAADPNQFRFFVIPAQTDRDFVGLGVGVVATLPYGVSAFVNYDTIIGLRNISDNVFSVGGRYEF